MNFQLPLHTTFFKSFLFINYSFYKSIHRTFVACPHTHLLVHPLFSLWTVENRKGQQCENFQFWHYRLPFSQKHEIFRFQYLSYLMDFFHVPWFDAKWIIVSIAKENIEFHIPIQSVKIKIKSRQLQITSTFISTDMYTP